VNKRQQNTLQTFRAALDWLAGCPDLTGVGAAALTPIGVQAAAFATAVDDAAAAAAEQERSRREAKGSVALARKLRKELVSNQMVHVATVARSARPHDARMVEALRVRHTQRGAQYQLAAAEAMAVAAGNYRAELARGGLAEDIPAVLRGAAAAFSQAFEARGSAVAARTGATARAHHSLLGGRRRLDLLTALLKRALRNDKPRFAAWMQVRRVAKVAVRRAGPSKPPLAGTEP
jgi:hypothetical protein